MAYRFRCGRWGACWQPPRALRTFDQEAQAVARWRAHKYPAIRALARRQKALIFWADAMGLRSDYAAGRSFSPCGQTPVIWGTGQRFRCNLISAITNRGQMQCLVFRERFTVRALLKFLHRLRRQNRRNIFLILDRHPVHLAKGAWRWFKAHRAHLRLYFLPVYSPELTSDEYLNQDVKTNAAGRTRPLNRQEIIGNLRAYLRST